MELCRRHESTLLCTSSFFRLPILGLQMIPDLVIIEFSTLIDKLALLHTL